MSATLYLDTNVFIRAFEGNDALSYALIDLLAVRKRDNSPIFATSELTLAELLVHPLRHGDDAGRERYDRMIRPSSWLAVGSVDRKILTGAALLRSKYSLKLPDAIHLSTALHLGCDGFLTGDSGLGGSYSLALGTTRPDGADPTSQIIALDLDTVTKTTDQLRA